MNNKQTFREKLLGNRKGQSIVEISLITPLVLIALYVPADFGMAFFTAHLAQNAVREGARIGAAMKTWDQSQIISEVDDRLPALFLLHGATSNDPPDVTATLSGTAGDTCMRTVTVTVNGSYTFGFYRLLGLFGFTTSPYLPISRTTSTRYEFQPVTYSTQC